MGNQDGKKFCIQISERERTLLISAIQSATCQVPDYEIYSELMEIEKKLEVSNNET